ncbi:esterase/lipase [Trichodelitschia bisporula]|uniref:Esterase/lipase n=1 Tax=Trichodelitschia bisporula TaxID=703511 RepID=A0A6G1I1X4_9PEZI|nr:esterase/lipase [Trichodelitschia bisporula]
MASHPPQQCCTIGVKHEGEASGEITTIGGIETYVVYPKDKSTANAVLLLTDVIGHKFINAQLIADQFAANGYFTVVPDIFEGDPLQLNRPADFDFNAWRSKHGVDKTEPIVHTIIKELRGSLGVMRIGGVGYCFGAKYVVRNLEPGAIDVGYLAHPSFIEADEVRAIKGPLSIAAAETDQIFPPPKRHETEEILLKLDVPYQISLYSDVQHGFAVRADITQKRVKFAKEQAFFQAVAWFDAFLKE